MRERFGKMPDGTPVERVAIRGGGLTAHVMAYGAVIQDLRLEDHDAPLVLGFDKFAPYLTHSPYFGATAGRCANRIRNGHLEMDGQTYQLDQNFLGKHMLHGGSRGMGKRVWTIDKIADDRVSLSLTQAAGDMGFPGALTTRLVFSLLSGGVFDIRIEAETDAPTLCNIAHHSYFTLGGETISDHLMKIDAESYLPVDDELIPTGEIRPVAGTPFDFGDFRPVRQAHKVDHNFCLSFARGPLRPVLWLKNRDTGIAMELRTTEPGLQVYDGAKIDVDLNGLSGRPMRAHAGIALEPQVWPDANHHDGFPKAVLCPGERYVQHTQYIFSRTTG